MHLISPLKVGLAEYLMYSHMLIMDPDNPEADFVEREDEE